MVYFKFTKILLCIQVINEFKPPKSKKNKNPKAKAKNNKKKEKDLTPDLSREDLFKLMVNNRLLDIYDLNDENSKSLDKLNEIYDLSLSGVLQICNENLLPMPSCGDIISFLKNHIIIPFCASFGLEKSVIKYFYQL
ncbi:MAG: hypothetical protein MHPSP_000020 [Paramarteilia canceri]